MEIFAKIQKPYRWYLLNNKNVRSMLSAPPYRQKNKIFAICPYCFNPIQVILKGHTSNNFGKYYAKHLIHSPFNEVEINFQRLEHCIFKKQERLLAKGAVPANIDLDDFDIAKLRRVFYSMLHVTMSGAFLRRLLVTTKKALYYTYADEYNYPFMMLLEMDYLLLNHRHLAYYPPLIDAINDKSKFFKVTSSKHEVVAKDENDEISRLYFVFDGQQIDPRSKLNFLNIKVVEENKKGNYYAEIYKFKVFIRGFDSLLGKDKRY